MNHVRLSVHSHAKSVWKEDCIAWDLNPDYRNSSQAHKPPAAFQHLSTCQNNYAQTYYTWRSLTVPKTVSALCSTYNA